MKKIVIVLNIILANCMQAMEYMPVEMKACIMSQLAQVTSISDAYKAVKNLENLARVNYEFRAIYRNENNLLAQQFKTEFGGELEEWQAILGKFEALKKLTKNKNKKQLNDEFIDAVNSKKIVKVLAYLQAGADVNGQDKYGTTALMVAVEKNNKEIVELLIKCGATVNSQDKFGNTALMYAAMKNKKELAELLIKVGADVNIQNIDGYNALMCTILYNSNKELVELLLTAGANVNAQNKYGQASLIYAVNKSKIAITKLLLKAGADSNAQDINGLTALALAAERNNKKIVELLKAHNA